MTDKSHLVTHTEPSPVNGAQNDGPSLSAEETSLKYMLKLAWPMVITNISFTIMQFVDVRMVAELGTNELAAILPAGFLSFMPSSFALGVITIVSTFVSQSLGRGNKKDCSSYCWQVIYMGLAFSAVTLAIMWPLAPAMFKAMGQPVEIIGMEVVYLRIMLYSQFIVVFTWSCSQFFMGIHRPIITMYAALAGQVVNVAANYVLIFGKLGFPRMGIAGAGWGTFIGLAVGAVIGMFMFLTGQVSRTFGGRRTLHVDFGRMLDIVKVGFPAGFGLMVNIAFWGLILFGLVGRFGKEHLAATSAVWSCIRVSFMPIVGIGTALTAAVGKSIGRRRCDLAIRQTGVCLRVALFYMGLVGVCFFIFRKGLMAFWTSDGKVIEIGIDLLICAAIFQLFDAVLIIYYGALRGAGDTVWLAAVEAVAAALILGAGGFCMVKIFPQLGALGPWIAATAKIVFGGVANCWRFKSNRWMQIDLFRHRPLGAPVEIGAVVE
ncbi:MAG TPA: MATE family efflux transporter [Sedimentisphaerales bacterium]|nr:MATE family efflux transporter [Sedimentisphaerales bacterium]